MTRRVAVQEGRTHLIKYKTKVRVTSRSPVPAAKINLHLTVTQHTSCKRHETWNTYGTETDPMLA